jgi:hypothetical protein
MEYLRDRGAQADVPAAEIVATFEDAYPNLTKGVPPAGRFREEARPTPGD